MIDRLPDSDWFFCFPLSWGVFFIAMLGVLHPMCWISVMSVFRSELFIFIYVLIVFWSLLSMALIYAMLEEVSCIYVFWINYTLAFAVLMGIMMVVLFCGFYILGKRRKCVWVMVGLVYYLVTLYFVVVVNKQRKEMFGLQNRDCGDCSKTTVTTPTTLPTTTPTTLPTTTPTTLPTTTPSKTVGPSSTSGPTKVTTTSAPHKTTKGKLRTDAEDSTGSTKPPTPSTTTNTTKGLLEEPSMAALLAADNDSPGETTRTWVVDPFRRDMGSEEPKTLRSVELDRVARLAELLINSDECRTPHKPAHGRYIVRKRRGSSLRLKLRCEDGYRENSVETRCKYNWWDRPIPQCRKRKQPVPLPPPGTGCVMPDYPKNGMYTVADHAGAKPGDRVAGDNVIVMVTCNQPYRPVDPYVVCVEGRWRHAPPSCRKHCKLVFDPTVEYKCLKAFKDKFLACSAWQPDKAIVAASCRPGHAHRGPFRYMRCRGVAWDHVVSCLPNANFTR